MVDLEWTRAGGTRFELEHQPPGSTPQVRYDGTQASSVRSGLGAGRHRFRVRATNEDGEAGPWSPPLALEVTYMDAGKVRLLLILGALVVTSTVVVILHGHFTHQRNPAR
ncbi:hypothetical protein [Haloferula sp. A504]|uniref:hypothetical protein n=1 Tax=Haloferula sp. A504 TaxID=3373601 RepID=UPI0031CAB87A|nr:fibronectin type III domain-containing protein [Verrucomicrobiaceae bacterium E54]